MFLTFYVIACCIEDHSLEADMKLIAAQTLNDAVDIAVQNYRRDNNLHMGKNIDAIKLYESEDPALADQVFKQLWNGTREVFDGSTDT